MRKYLAIAAAAATVASVAACGGASSGASGGGGGGVSSSSSSSSISITNSAWVPAGYSLVWNDEFSGTGLPDATKWVDDTTANTYTAGNGELQYYTAADLDNQTVTGGQLHITARKEDMTGSPNYMGQHYSSARIVTRGKADWTYGFFDVRAKMPCGAGTWPAIWTLASGGTWPTDGELDIMEQLGRDPNTIYGTVHDDFNQAHFGDGNSVAVTDACGTFHNYEMTWTADKVEIAVDGVVYSTYTNAHTGHAQWPFTAPQYLLLNLALGGSWAGPVDDTALPREFVVDYVRVYQKP